MTDPVSESAEVVLNGRTIKITSTEHTNHYDGDYDIVMLALRAEFDGLWAFGGRPASRTVDVQILKAKDGAPTEETT